MTVEGPPAPHRWWIEGRVTTDGHSSIWCTNESGPWWNIGVTRAPDRLHSRSGIGVTDTAAWLRDIWEEADRSVDRPRRRQRKDNGQRTLNLEAVA